MKDLPSDAVPIDVSSTRRGKQISIPKNYMRCRNKFDDEAVDRNQVSENSSEDKSPWKNWI